MKYGTIIREKPMSASVVLITEEKIVKGEHVGEHATYCESIRISSHADVLAQMLGLQDRHKRGEIIEYGIRTFNDAHGNLIRIEKLWKV